MSEANASISVSVFSLNPVSLTREGLRRGTLDLLSIKYSYVDISECDRLV